MLSLAAFSVCTHAQYVTNPSDVLYIPGTLRYEIDNANPGDVLYLTGLTGAVHLQDEIIFTKDVTLIGTPGVTTIDGDLIRKNSPRLCLGV